MCGIVGFVNYKQDVSRFRNILINMNNTLVRRGPDEDGYYIRKHIALAHKRLIVIDPEGGKQPMVESCSKSIPLQKENSDMVINYNSNFVISYNGQIYNTDELRKTLEENGFTFNGHCDTEILLKSYILRKRCCKTFKWNLCFCNLGQSKRRIIYCKRSFWSKTFILYYAK